jgi:CheY-like chemotaxis protein
MPQVLERPLLLIVEDHADTRQMYAEFLGSSYDVQQAANGEQALDAMNRRVPSLVITDFSLPGIDGFELIRRMRSEHTTRNVPVICLSGYVGSGHEQQAQASGCDCVLEKPCLPDKLAQTARDLIDRGRSAPGERHHS